jgi:hypothetical protein
VYGFFGSNPTVLIFEYCNLPFGLGILTPLNVEVYGPSGYPNESNLLAYYARRLGPLPMSFMYVIVGV